MQRGPYTKSGQSVAKEDFLMARTALGRISWWCHRWLAVLESGDATSMKEIARCEGVDDSYVSRMVNLTTLAPDIVAAILDETLPSEVTLFELAAGTPVVWATQRGRIGRRVYFFDAYPLRKWALW
jgi:hypothetical protein